MKHRPLVLTATVLLTATLMALTYLLGWWGERYRVAVGMNLADCVDAAARVMEPHCSSIEFGTEHWYGETEQPLDVVVASVQCGGAPQKLLLVATRPMTTRWAEGKLSLNMEDSSWTVAQLIVCPHWQNQVSGGGNYWQTQLQGAEYPESLSRRSLRALCKPGATPLTRHEQR